MASYPEAAKEIRSSGLSEKETKGERRGARREDGAKLRRKKGGHAQEGEGGRRPI